MVQIMGRVAARSNNLTTYINGKPCQKGHYAARYTSTGNCVTCVKESTNKRYLEDKAQREQYVKLRVHVDDVELVEAINTIRRLGV